MSRQPTPVNSIGGGEHADLILEQSIGFSGHVKHGLHTCKDGTMIYVAGSWVIISHKDD
eukprot:CAMPEP_0196587112 /NCGR_PEP_ID=MMETSP1081-20130531/56495_1 /TAXON_ID=36882 /ORGANISM="Pyramimonas amylifera, Strain CCMP720" /LENGTH=58 /DNA_ID=CAMNT_0041909207 /DNA_START=83 /DNA_END=256 /DNA_ORIENTATION=+